jgi:hypothetical protein
MTKSKVLSRRAFLLSSGAGTAALATAIALPKEKSLPTKRDRRATLGYQNSEHINNYYRTTKV